MPKGYTLGSDLFGSDTYSHSLSLSLTIKLKHLKQGGYFVTLIPTESYSFNFKSVRVGTRIHPISKRAVEFTNLEKRISDYLKMNGFEVSEYVDILNNISLSPLPTKFRTNLDGVCCGDTFSEVSARQELMNSQIELMKTQISGILGWIEAIQGVEIVALTQIPNTQAETGIFLALKRTEKPLVVPPLELKYYEYDSGPPTRIYTW